MGLGSIGRALVAGGTPVSGALAVYRKSNFAPAFWCLAPRRRRALSAVYAFARAVDDAVDEVGIEGKNPAEAQRILNAWREALRSDAAPPGIDGSLWPYLRGALTDFRVDRRHLLELVDGVERDLTQTRYADAGEVDDYCFGVAGTVGLACLPIFGLDVEKHRDFAVALGRAVQWVNILRDVKTDALRGRIYLPREDLTQFGVGEEEITGLVHSGRFRDLLAFEADRATAYFEEAERLLPLESRGPARPARVMGRLYRRLLDKMRAGEFRVFAERPRLSFFEKIGCLVSSGKKVAI